MVMRFFWVLSWDNGDNGDNGDEDSDDGRMGTVIGVCLKKILQGHMKTLQDCPWLKIAFLLNYYSH